MKTVDSPPHGPGKVGAEATAWRSFSAVAADNHLGRNAVFTAEPFGHNNLYKNHKKYS